MELAQSFYQPDGEAEIKNLTFCALCLRQRPSDNSFFGYKIGANSNFCKTMNTVLGFKLELGDFYSCKSCLKLVQLLQEFRACCLEANAKLNQFGKGLQTDDQWLTARTAQVIENFRVTVAAHADLIRKEDFGGAAALASVKVEPGVSCKDFMEASARLIKVEIEEPVEETEPEYLDFTQEMVSDMVEGEILIEEGDDDDIDFSTWIKSTDEDEGSEAVDLPPIEISECDNCHRTFDSRKGLRMHFPKCKGEEDGNILKHKCHICSISFKYPALLKTHMNKHEGRTPYKCRKQCDRSFAGNVNRYIHEMQCAKEPQTCPICNCEPKSKRALMDHMIAVHGEAKHACGQCGMKFRRISWLTQHRVKVHGASVLKGNQPVVKVTPVKKSKPERVPVYQEKPVPAPLSFECDECGKGFTHWALVLYHKRHMHPA